MKNKLSLFAAFLLLIGAATSCEKDGNPGDAPTLSVAPSTALAFSAAATESFEITVSTNQDSWSAISNQSWCVVTKGSGKFTVTAAPNNAATSPTPAIITITAGDARSVAINVTQAAKVGGVEPVKKYITQITHETGLPKRIANFFYDDNRKIAHIYNKNSTYTYPDAATIVKTGNNPVTYSLNSGGYISSSSDAATTYDYNSGYLAKKVYSASQLVDYVWENGNLKTKTSSNLPEGKNPEYIVDNYEYSSVDASLGNMDLNLWLCSGTLYYENILCFDNFSGKRSRNLISKIVSGSYTDSYSYDTDADGYVVKIYTLRSTGEIKTLLYTLVYEE